MSENQAASDWAATRGEKWLANLDGTEAMIAPVNEPLVRALRLDAVYRIADVGCGGGRTTLEILRRGPPGTVVHGFDISPALVEIARARKATGEHSADFFVADMATAKPANKLYDRLVSRFGIMFFDDPSVAFANLARWLAPGGRFAFAVWGPMAENLWMTSVRDVVGKFIALPETDLEGPGPFRYGDAGKLLALLDAAGLSELDTGEWRGALPMGGGLAAAEAAQRALASLSSFQELLTEAGGDVFNQARQALTERFAEYEQDGAVRIEACVRIVTGMRPV